MASLQPCKNYHPNRVSKYRQYFDEVKTEDFDFSNGFRCSDVHKFEKLNNLSLDTFESNFYHDENNWKHNLIPIEICQNDESDRVVDLILYKKHYAPFKKLNVFLRDHHKNFICRRCLNSYTSENMLLIHKPKCENYNITTNTTSSESHLHWKHHFHKIVFYFRNIADLMLIMKLKTAKLSLIK